MCEYLIVAEDGVEDFVLLRGAEADSDDAVAIGAAYERAKQNGWKTLTVFPVDESIPLATITIP